MSIINTFWILFKSNSEDVIKGNKAIEKSTKETERSLKNTNEEASKLGQSFVKMVEGAAGAAGAYIGFNAIKNGVNQTAEYNKQLGVMGKLLGQNASTMDTFARAAEAAGGSVAGALSDISGISQSAVRLGLPVPAIDKYAERVRDWTKNQTPNEKLRTLGMAGFNDPGLQRIIGFSSDAEFGEWMSKNRSTLTPAEIDAALKLQETKSSINKSSGNFFSRLLEYVSPGVTAGGDKASDLLNAVAGNKAATLGGTAAGIAASAYGLGKIGGAFAEGGVATGLGATAVGLGGLGLGGVAGYGLVSHYSDAIERMMVKWMTRDLKGGSISGALQGTSGDLGFWMGQGYTREQAAGIIANMRHESAGNAGAVGDGGAARGLFQWHPDRRDAILKATGIDVTNAGYQDQLKAAAWEMKNGRPQFDDDHFRSIKNADEAAAYFSQRFESPANGTMQAIMRGKTALSLASQFPTLNGGGGGSVKIDKIEIVTQATDAVGIASELKDAVVSALSFLGANSDDGVSR